MIVFTPVEVLKIMWWLLKGFSFFGFKLHAGVFSASILFVLFIIQFTFEVILLYFLYQYHRIIFLSLFSIFQDGFGLWVKSSKIFFTFFKIKCPYQQYLRKQGSKNRQWCKNRIIYVKIVSFMHKSFYVLCYYIFFVSKNCIIEKNLVNNLKVSNTNTPYTKVSL